MGYISKDDAISIVTKCAVTYREELDGKTLLIVGSDKHHKLSFFEVSFYGNNYLHLTGLKANGTKAQLHANKFYKKCLSHKLSANDFSFSADGTSKMKLEILPSIICGNLGATIIGDFNSSSPKLYTEKIVGNVRACMGFVYDAKLGKMVPNTAIKEDARNLVKSSWARVVATFRKDTTSDHYEEIVYKAKKVDLKDLCFPNEYRYLLDIEWNGITYNKFDR